MDSYNDLHRFAQKTGERELAFQSFNTHHDVRFSSQWVLLNDIASLDKAHPQRHSGAPQGVWPSRAPVQAVTPAQANPAPKEESSALRDLLRQVSA